MNADHELFVKKLTNFINAATYDPKVDNNIIISTLALLQSQVCQITLHEYVKKICEECGGIGQVGYNTDDPQVCPKCNGSGVKNENRKFTR